MTSSPDNYADLDELIDEDDIADDGNDAHLFTQATTYVQSAAATLDNAVLLQLYAHYKQAIEGECSAENRPSWYDFRAKSKYEAWNALGAMPKAEARSRYIEIVQSLGHDLTATTRNEKREDGDSVDERILQVKNAVGWVTHSTLQQYGANHDDDANDDVCDDPNMKTLLDMISSNDLPAVKDHLSRYPDLVWCHSGRDRLTPAHYAADRGAACVLEHMLLTTTATSNTNSVNGGIVAVDAKDVDGQTPLHYASACGHAHCCRLLLKCGANVMATDNDSNTCLDVAADDHIKQVLTTTSTN